MNVVWFFYKPFAVMYVCILVTPLNSSVYGLQSFEFITDLYYYAPLVDN